ncbi:MAG: hypothetical protein IJA85_08835 [Clostridia bacterium]|nr:hypothetical protein [Clostridia bacterium]
MTLRENTLAILRYQSYDRFPIVSFGYWVETLQKWADEGYITRKEADGYARFGDNSEADCSIMARLGFDFNWNSCVSCHNGLLPGFETELLETKADGSQIIRDSMGLICMIKPGVVSIPAEIGTTLTDREAWETLYKPKLQPSPARIPTAHLAALSDVDSREIPLGLQVGSLIGTMRNLLGVAELSYLYADDEELFGEIVDTMCGLCYENLRGALASGGRFDYGHYWEDICCKSGPLITPECFRDHIAPWYKKMTSLMSEHGIDIVSVDCDGMIDALLPIWLESGVNTMFPIEVGTWNASIAPWRELYGKELRGVGGMNKTVFSRDRAAVDEEIDRLTKLIALGGYIPCPDHRIAPDAKFELVQYYCEKAREAWNKI